MLQCIAKELCNSDNIYLGCLAFATLAIGGLFIVEYPLRRIAEIEKNALDKLNNGETVADSETVTAVKQACSEISKHINPGLSFLSEVGNILSFIVCIAVGLVINLSGRLLISAGLLADGVTLSIIIFLHVFVIGMLVYYGNTMFKPLLKIIKQVAKFEKEVNKFIDSARDKKSAMHKLVEDCLKI